MTSTGRVQVLPWGILGNWRLAPAPRARPLSLVPQHACQSLLHASSGSFPCEPGHVAGPAGMQGGRVRAEGSRLPAQHHEQLALEVPSRDVYLGKGAKTIRCRLWVEVGKAQNRQQEGQDTRTCCAAETAFARARGRDREGQGRACHLCPLLVLHGF